MSVGGEFVVQQVVEMLLSCELVRWWVVLYNMSVAGVRVVEFGTYYIIHFPFTYLFKRIVQHHAKLHVMVHNVYGPSTTFARDGLPWSPQSV